MKVKKVTKTYYELEDGRRYEFDEPLEKVPSPKQLQAMLEANAQHLKDLTDVTDCK